MRFLTHHLCYYGTMSPRSKIVGINRETPETQGSGDELLLESEAVDAAELPEIDGEEAIGDVYYDEEVNAYPVARNWTMPAIAISLALLLAAWTGFFVWNQMQVFQTVPSNMDIISMIGAWALPAALLGIVWLLALRHSRAETGRFAEAGAQLRVESEALELRMRTVNEEIALARDFLAQNALELESLGRQSSDMLTVAATQLNSALADSDEKAKRLEEVSNAAASNLEQLRKHLPVVTSAAKDVSNQIGAAGNNAQDQVNGLIETLSAMNKAGSGARETISALEQQAAEATGKITNTISESARAFTEEMAHTGEASDAIADRLRALSKDSVVTVNKASRKLKARTADTVEKLDAKLLALNAALERSTEDASDRVSGTIAKLDGMLSGASQKLTAQLERVKDELALMQSGIDTQDSQLIDMVERISQQIDKGRIQIEALDAGATEKTSNLAFAIETLVHSTQELDTKVTGSNDGARDLVAQAERLNELLAQANQEVCSALPDAVSSIEEKLSSNFAVLEHSRDASRDIEKQSETLLARMTQIDTVIAAQREAIDKLFTASDEQVTNQHEQASALSDSLKQTHSAIDNLAQQSNAELLTSIANIRDAAEDAVGRSKKTIEDGLSAVTEKLTGQNATLLDDAIESQLSAIGERMQSAVAAQLQLSQDSASKLTTQLSQIEEMTRNLEQRLDDTQSGFGGIDQEGFARRMALLTESLNSTAIDVAKILSNDVTDTAWSSYLKGDRGVFTRRAVKLLDSGEARAIAEHYENEPEFAEHVNRYIHDFEAMMRVLLSTRDGNAIGVTILSSDVGKLYVALAQAIERLRG